ncbi:hypothetical protein STENM36S_01627 [Streptomyces tendae]
MATDARLVKSTWRRAVVRRSTRGSGVCSSHQPQTSRITPAAANRPRVVAEDQPQSPPLEMASSRLARPAAMPMPPSRSKRPPVRTADSGTRARTSTRETAPSAPESQNSMCQSSLSAISAAAGRPSAPPTPREALITAVAPASRSTGSSSRMMLMPSGITAADRPCRARPATIGTSASLSPQTAEPAISSTRLSSSIRRLPNMSPSRPTTGVATAEASSVAVTAQAASEADASRSFGSSGMIGITRVCISATTIPARASTATTAFGRGEAGEAGMEEPFGRGVLRRVRETGTRTFKSVA